MAELVDSMLDLMRRLPPTRTEENVNALITICPEYADDLLGSVDQPLQLKTDRATGREYLACDYNRDGESYRCVLLCGLVCLGLMTMMLCRGIYLSGI
jgi:capping protein beta